jgi:tetratricopeptide (TPR) repeat protein
MYALTEREEHAIATWRKAIDLAPDAHTLRYDLAYMYLRRNQHSLAAEEFAKLLTFWPEDVETNFLLGLCYKELLEPSRAIPLFEKVLRTNARHSQALYHLGATYLQLGNISLGKAYLRRYDTMSSKARQRPSQLQHMRSQLRSLPVVS